jgi:23S rRNA (cytidine1920-2'-O)/16S rRNA (cytidine1409-2'-O)-methyltransferase
VRDPEVREEAVRDVLQAAESMGFVPEGTMESPVKGAGGNVEFLACFVWKGEGKPKSQSPKTKEN